MVKRKRPEDSFEEIIGLSGHREVERVQDLEMSFLKDLAAKADVVPTLASFSEDQREALRLFTLTVLMNIGWYRGKLRTDRAKAGWFVVLNLLLLAIVPIVVYFIPSFLAAQSRAWSLPGPSLFPGDAIIAQVSAVLTGLLALFKALGTLMSKNVRVGRFWKASADLRELYFSLRSNWWGKAYGDDQKLVLPRLFEEMRQAVAKARTIVREEQDDFFATYALPAIDVGSLLGTAQTQAAGLVAQFRPPALALRGEREKVRVEADRKVTQLAAECRMFAGEISKKVGELAAAEAAPDRTRVQSEIEGLRSQKATRDIELIQAKAAAEALSQDPPG